MDNYEVTEGIIEEITNYLKTSGNEKKDNLKSIGCSKSSAKREVESNTNLPHESTEI